MLQLTRRELPHIIDADEGVVAREGELIGLGLCVEQ